MDKPHFLSPRTDPCSTSFESPPSSDWSVADSVKLYGIENWSNHFFGISEAGHVEVYLDEEGRSVALSLLDIIKGTSDRGLEVPLLLRFQGLLAARIEKLNQSFEEAISLYNYRGKFRGVYPIKVNQQQQVIKEITQFGRRFHFGLEAGSKPELLAAMAYLRDPEAYLVCNGYKDRAFIDLALSALKMGIQTVLVIETPGELDLILDRGEALNVRPVIGVRAKLAARNDGRWSRSSGESSVFGLTADQIMDVVDELRAADRLDCLQMLHYHQGSQIPDIRAIRDAATEATRIYVELSREGAAMGLIDIGGGLAVDYDGSQSNTASSRNYGTLEYASDIVETVMAICDESGLPHPDIISESGRAIASYYSVLVFNVLDVNRFVSHVHTTPFPEKAHVFLNNLRQVDELLDDDNLQECYNDAVYYRGELLTLFNHGQISLRERAYADSLYWQIVTHMQNRLRRLGHVPDGLEALDNLNDVYYGNFSLFQSLPDSWAIGHLFPVMPIHRLDERPSSTAIIADITCDCDGRMDEFLVAGKRQGGLPLHPLNEKEEYYLGAFLVGAYQETLGDLHNLFGDTNVVNISVRDGQAKFSSELRGDTVADVLSYVEYDPAQLINRFRSFAEKAVEDGRMSVQERRSVMEVYEESIRGYTYFEG